MKIEEADTYWVKIFIAGDIGRITHACREYCTRGACVTVTPTNYVYTYGEESGAIIELINYPRFPKSDIELEQQAEELAYYLMEECCQGSFSIMNPKTTTFHSRRKQD